MERPENRPPEFVDALAKGLSILEAFDASHPEMTLSEVARRVGLSPAAARRSLITLSALGYVGQRAKQIERPVLIALTAIIQTVSKPDGDCPRDSIQGWWEELAGENKLPAWDTDIYTAARSILVRYRIICIDHHRYQYVPDAKGQCKGIWIREQEIVGERNYSFPSDDLPLVPPCIRVMTLVIDHKTDWSSQIRESRPPP